MTPTYFVDASWTTTAELDIEADSPEEARRIVEAFDFDLDCDAQSSRRTAITIASIERDDRCDHLDDEGDDQ